AVLAALDARGCRLVIAHRETLARLRARHAAARTMAATGEAVRVATAAHDEGSRPHRSRYDAQLPVAGPHGTLAGHPHVFAEVRLTGDIVVVTVHRSSARRETRQQLAH